MIHVSKHQLSQVEYLIQQSTFGHHPLFDEKILREVFGDGTEPESTSPAISDEDAYATEPELERLILQPTLAEKRAYLRKLDRQTQKRIVRTYFNIIENNIFESLKARH